MTHRCMDWWEINGDTDYIPKFMRLADVFFAGRVKIVMNKCEPFTWSRSKKQAKDIP